MSEPTTTTPTRKSGTRTAADCVVWYILLVAFCSLLRGTASYFGGPAWILESMPWPEVFYGPAIAMGTVFAVSRVEPKVEAWLQRRRA